MGSVCGNRKILNLWGLRARKKCVVEKNVTLELTWIQHRICGKTGLSFNAPRFADVAECCFSEGHGDPGNVSEKTEGAFHVSHLLQQSDATDDWFCDTVQQKQVRRLRDFLLDSAYQRASWVLAC